MKNIWLRSMKKSSKPKQMTNVNHFMLDDQIKYGLFQWSSRCDSCEWNLIELLVFGQKKLLYRLRTELETKREKRIEDKSLNEFFVSFDWPELDFDWETESGELKFLRLAKNDKRKERQKGEKRSKKLEEGTDAAKYFWAQSQEKDINEKTETVEKDKNLRRLRQKRNKIFKNFR